MAKETLYKLKYPNGKQVDEKLSFKFDVLTKLGTRAGNINFDIEQFQPKVVEESSSASDSEIENEIFKT